jgi:hypothetical protein
MLVVMENDDDIGGVEKKHAKIAGRGIRGNKKHLDSFVSKDQTTNKQPPIKSIMGLTKNIYKYIQKIKRTTRNEHGGTRQGAEGEFVPNLGIGCNSTDRRRNIGRAIAQCQQRNTGKPGW